MQAIVELLVAVIVWMAVASLNQLGLKVDMPDPPAKAERVIQRESAPDQKADARDPDCPDVVKTARPKARAA
ncbi:hypothetical protein [Caulobacter sp. NIBR1757]|uniref:hypothetical protein n=1 Tax=Caulobacter sp. NIBR1757 TaxID=3016000 RepID=UPI0022F0D505|nr:hypothetical protein [Caulobacter sp. NIBR1757]WGM38935.1 hypothetical protein AMEJIAPC_01845 [Caulobacter sp. NIBR1757]